MPTASLTQLGYSTQRIRPIQIPQLQNDLAAGRIPVPLAHIGGLNTAGMHKLEQLSFPEFGVPMRLGDLAQITV